MIKKIVLASAVSTLLLGAGVAQAEVAKVVSVGGKAVVERGSHQYNAKPGMFLEEGDVVRSLEGKVELKYSNCVSYIEAAKEVEVSKSSPCATAKASSTPALPSTTVAKVGSGISVVPVLAGVAGVAAAAGSSSGSSSAPTSKAVANANASVSP